MPYVPRPPIPTVCAHCQTAFESRHRRRKYCCNSCNVLAAHARKKTDGTAPVGYTTAASYAVPARFAAAVGPVEPVGSYFFLGLDGAPQLPAHRFRSARNVRWLTASGEFFPRTDFALDTAGTVWLESYGHDEERWFVVVAIEDLPAA